MPLSWLLLSVHILSFLIKPMFSLFLFSSVDTRCLLCRQYYLVWLGSTGWLALTQYSRLGRIYWPHFTDKMRWVRSHSWQGAEPELAPSVLPSLSFKYFQGWVSPPTWESFIHLLALDSVLGTVASMIGKAWHPPSFPQAWTGAWDAPSEGVTTVSQEEVTKWWLSPLYLVLFIYFCFVFYTLNEMSTLIQSIY